PAEANIAVDRAFVVSLEVRRSEVTDRADVILPVAPPAEKAGAYVNWEGRVRPFPQVLPSAALSDARVLQALAAELGHDIPLGDPAFAHRALAELGAPETRPAPPAAQPEDVPRPEPGQALLATWRLQLDSGRGQDCAPQLAAGAKAPVAILSEATARDLGVGAGQPVTVSTARGTITLPAAPRRGVPDRVVWLPANSPGSQVRRTLGTATGIVQLTKEAGA
ncbi:MAG: molybdopterin-dependent oxidoreductase, partial [Bifidobacteriaceae bacterium]|nr:molybdopterin-dependent oxidoreductase [Bifidobacteriaceae bacterium]